MPGPNCSFHYQVPKAVQMKVRASHKIHDDTLTLADLFNRLLDLVTPDVRNGEDAILVTMNQVMRTHHHAANLNGDANPRDRVISMAR